MWCDGDIKNWASLAISILLWPLILKWHDQSRKPFLKGLDISIDPDMMAIGGIPHPAARFTFVNRTDQAIYLTNLDIMNCTDKFKIHHGSHKDIQRGAYELKFLSPPPTSLYELREGILNPNEVAVTCIALDAPLLPEVKAHKPKTWFNWLRSCKYFRLEYSAMIGTKPVKVGINY